MIANKRLLAGTINFRFQKYISKKCEFNNRFFKKSSLSICESDTSEKKKIKALEVRAVMKGLLSKNKNNGRNAYQQNNLTLPLIEFFRREGLRGMNFLINLIFTTGPHIGPILN